MEKNIGKCHPITRLGFWEMLSTGDGSVLFQHLAVFRTFVLVQKLGGVVISKLELWPALKFEPFYFFEPFFDVSMLDMMF